MQHSYEGRITLALRVQEELAFKANYSRFLVLALAAILFVEALPF